MLKASTAKQSNAPVSLTADSLIHQQSAKDYIETLFAFSFYEMINDSNETRKDVTKRNKTPVTLTAEKIALH